MKTSKGECGKCYKHRPVLIVTGPGLHEKGVDMCRPCHQAYKDALRREAKREAGAQPQKATDAEAKRAARQILEMGWR